MSSVHQTLNLGVRSLSLVLADRPTDQPSKMLIRGVIKFLESTQQHAKSIHLSARVLPLRHVRHLLYANVLGRVVFLLLKMTSIPPLLVDSSSVYETRKYYTSHSTIF